jgi:hypothetical protein
MEKSAINLQYVFLLGFVVLFSCLTTKTQGIEQSPMVTKAQYEFLTSVFDDKSTKSEKVYYQPRNTNLWLKEFLNSRSENGIGTCLYEDSHLKEAIDELQTCEFKVKMYEPSKFPKTIIPIKDSKKKKGLHISEPIMIGSYSFLLTWNNGYEAVEIYYNEQDKGWEFKCFIILSGKL